MFWVLDRTATPPKILEGFALEEGRGSAAPVSASDSVSG
jgi:hypothetical protein